MIYVFARKGVELIIYGRGEWLEGAGARKFLTIESGLKIKIIKRQQKGIKVNATYRRKPSGIDRIPNWPIGDEVNESLETAEAHGG